jgi:hypothetical protein
MVEDCLTHHPGTTQAVHHRVAPTYYLLGTWAKPAASPLHPHGVDAPRQEHKAHDLSHLMQPPLEWLIATVWRVHCATGGRWPWVHAAQLAVSHKGTTKVHTSHMPRKGTEYGDPRRPRGA